MAEKRRLRGRMWNFKDNPEAEVIISQYTSKPESVLFILKLSHYFSYRAKTPLKKLVLSDGGFIFVPSILISPTLDSTKRVCFSSVQNGRDGRENSRQEAGFLSLALFLFNDREYKKRLIIDNWPMNSLRMT